VSDARIVPQFRARGQNSAREPFQYRDLRNHGVCLRYAL
jgi:hypothetical protein